MEGHGKIIGGLTPDKFNFIVLNGHVDKSTSCSVTGLAVDTEEQ